MPSPEYALPTGTVLRGRYRIEEVLGAGAFGITYRATDTGLDSTVVVKELCPEDYRMGREGTGITVPTAKEEQHQNLVERMLAQGRLLRKLDHPHLMSVYEAFEAHNTAYLVVEHLEGPSLREQLDRRGTLPETEVWHLIEEVGAGLSVLHEEEALHLDVKPANIVKASGKYVVIDYGAGRMGSVEDSVQLSTGGYTPAYAAYEQTDDSLEKGPYTDIYALGVTAYECATGERPPTSTARMMMEGGLTWPSGLGGSLRAALEGALRIEPGNRPASVEAWLSEPETVEMPPAEEDHPEPEEERGADRPFHDWLSARRLTTAVLPVIAVGVLFVGLEWGGVTQLQERFYTMDADSSTPAAEEDSSRTPVAEEEEGAVKQEGHIAKGQRGNDIAGGESPQGGNNIAGGGAPPTESSEPSSASKNQEASEARGETSSATARNNDGAAREDSVRTPEPEKQEGSVKKKGQSEAKRQDRSGADNQESAPTAASNDQKGSGRQDGKSEATTDDSDRARGSGSSSAQMLTSRGDSLKEEGRLPAALKSYTRAVEVDSTLAEAWKGRGDVLKEQDRIELAIESYERAVAEDSSNISSLVAVLKEKGGDLYDGHRSDSSKSEERRAVEIFRRVDKLAPPMEKQSVLYKLYQALLSLERSEAAFEVYKRGVNLASTREGFYAMPYASVAGERVDAEGAIKRFNLLVEEIPSYEYGWAWRGDFLREQGQLDKALQSYNRAIELDSSKVSFWTRRGEVLRKLGRLDEALRSYDQARSRDSIFSDWSGRGKVLEEQGRLDEALENYNNDLNNDPEDRHPNTLKSRGDVLADQGRFDSAAASYDRALRDGEIGLPPQNQQLEADLERYNRLLKADSSYTAVWQLRGDVLHELGRPEAAIQSYDRAVELAPSSGDIWKDRGDMLAKQERFEAAVQSYNRAVEEGSTYPYTSRALVKALNDRANELLEQGRLEAALTRYGRVLRIAERETHSGEAWNGRGKAMQQLGRFKEAVKSYNEACTLDTDHCSTYSSLKGSGQGLNSGLIRGTVLDEKGKPISDVTVTAIHRTTGSEWYTKTDANGNYTFTDLHIGGPYTLSAEFKWHRPAERTDIMLEIDDQRTIDLKRQTGQE